MKKYIYNEYDENQVYRTYKQRKKRKIKKRVKMIGCLIGIILIGVFIMSPLPKIKSINITGNEKISRESILEHISVNQSSFYFLVNKKEIKKEIESLSVIKNATVHINWIGHLYIEIEEALPIAYAQIGKEIYEINDTGRVVKAEDEESIQQLKGLPFVQNFTSLDLLKEFAEEFYKVPTLMQNEMSDIILEPKSADPKRLKCLMKEGKVIYIRIDDIALRLNDDQFNYEAYKTSGDDVCTFSIEGRNLYLGPCQ